MLKRWGHWFVDVQFGRARVIVLLVLAIILPLGWLFGHRPEWGFEAVAVVLLVFGGRWPLPVALGEAAVLAVASLVFPDEQPSFLATMAGLALLELAFRRPLWQAVAAAVALGAAYFAHKPVKAASQLDAILQPDPLSGGVAVSLLLGAWLRVVLIRSKERRARARA